MKNPHRITGDVAIIWLRHRGCLYKTSIDGADLDRVKAFPGRWSILETARGPLVRATVRDPAVPSKTTSLYLHRFLLRADADTIVAHLGDTLNNCRSNLKVITRPRAAVEVEK